MLYFVAVEFLNGRGLFFVLFEKNNQTF